MKKLKVAFATDDGKSFMGRHFGDSDYYYIYEIDNNSAEFIKKINNNTEEEEIHADPKKAKGITNLLSEENVNVVVSKVFGPNIKRIKKKFVCIIVKEEKVEKSIDNICNNIENIFNEWEKGDKRRHLSF